MPEPFENPPAVRPEGEAEPKDGSHTGEIGVDIDCRVEGVPYRSNRYVADLILVFPFSEKMRQRFVVGEGELSITSPRHGSPSPRNSSAVLGANVSTKFSNAVKTIMGQITSRGVIDSILACSETERAEVAPHCHALLEEESQGKIYKEDFRVALLKDIIAHLVKHEFVVKMFKSIDEDELFLCITMGDPQIAAQDNATALKMANLKRYALQTAFDAQKLADPKGLNIKQKNVEPAFFEYNKSVVAEGTKLFCGSGSLFKQYSESISGCKGSILRHVDRIRLTRMIMEEFMDLELAVGSGVIINFYAMHKALKLAEFSSGQARDPDQFKPGHPAWSNFRPMTILMGVRGENGQPIQEIRDYFGERTAFYFLWLGFTANSLAKVLIFSVPFIIGFYGGLADTKTKNGARIQAFSYVLGSLLISVWITTYQKGWTRLEKHYAELWGMETQKGQPETLASYAGDLVPNPLDENTTYKLYDWKKKVGLNVVAAFITLVFVTMVTTIIMLIYRFEEDLGGATYANLLMSAQVIGFQLIWDEVAEWLVQFQNPRNSVEHKDLAVVMLFPVSFIGTYTNLFFAAVHKTWYEQCVHDDCTKDLRLQLIQVVLPVIFVQFAVMLKPYFIYRAMLWEERWSLLRKIRREQRERGEQPDPSKEDGPIISFLEKQAKQWAYGIRELNRDFNIMTIVLGYVMLFGAIAPLQIFVVFVAFVVKIRIDAFKLCTVYSRVIPSVSGAVGIGNWNSVHKALATLGRMTTLAIPLINIKYFQSGIAEMPSACAHQNNGAMDRAGRTCDDGYSFSNNTFCALSELVNNSDECTTNDDEVCKTYNVVLIGYYDDEDFTAKDMCCGCGGGEVDAILAFVTPDGDSNAGVPFVTKALIWFILKELFDRFAQFIDVIIGDVAGSTELTKKKRKYVQDKFFERTVAKQTATEGDEDSNQRFRITELERILGKELHPLNEKHELWTHVEKADVGDPKKWSTFFGTGQLR